MMVLLVSHETFVVPRTQVVRSGPGVFPGHLRHPDLRFGFSVFLRSLGRFQGLGGSFFRWVFSHFFL